MAPQETSPVMKRLQYAIGFALLSLLAPAAAAQQAPAPVKGLEKIEHIVVIFMENRSFNNIYGLFPGANGVANAGEAAIQIDRDGKPYEKLPPVMNTNLRPAIPDTRFPADLPNGPFLMDKYAGPEQTTGDLTHRFYQNQLQINGGKNNKFVAYSSGGGLAMGYHDGSKLPLWQYAKRYTLMDNFFQAAFGGSMLNHFWLVCACTPHYPNAGEDDRAALDEAGRMIRDGRLTHDGYAVNTMQPRQGPHNPAIPEHHLLPPLDRPNIGDRLSEKNISWAWYAQGWSDALAGRNASIFQYHHQPFAYFEKYAPGTAAREQHLRDGAEFVQAIVRGELPSVSFYKPTGILNSHPGYASLLAGEQHAADILALIEKSPQWGKTLVIVTYDEYGGFWDHVAPPGGDRWGPGTRIPALAISPFAKKGFVDHTQYDTTSVLKLIETRFGLAPLGARDAAANDMTSALELN
jgi:phospholipase C